MFLFPWLHYGESIIDFEKSTFFTVRLFFTLQGSSQGDKVAVFDVGNYFGEPLKNFKSVENSKKNLEFCKKVSKVSVDSFMAV